MALSKDTSSTMNTASSWQDEDDLRAGSGPFGSPDLRASSGIDSASRHSTPRSSTSHHSTSRHATPNLGFEGDDESSAFHGSARPRRRDLMAGSRPRPIVPKSLSEAYRIAQAVCAAKMAPKGLDTPEACMIAIMHGLEVGLSPLSALQRIAVINGRPTLWGDGALALVKASGLCEAIDEWIEGDKPEDWVAVCNLIRKHDPVPIERRFSSHDAKRARLWGKSGPWSDYPKRMLQMRARAFALRDAFPDVLGGLYLTEEFVGSADERESEGPSQHQGQSHSHSHSQSQNQDQPANSNAHTAFRTVFADEETSTTGSQDHNAVDENIGNGNWKTKSQDNDSGSKAQEHSAHREHASLESVAKKIRDDDARGKTLESKASEEYPDRAEGKVSTHDAAATNSREENVGSALEEIDHSADGALVLPAGCVEPREASHDVGDREVELHHVGHDRQIAGSELPLTSKTTSSSEAGADNGTPFRRPSLPPLANLRRARHMPRHIRALRFRNQWSVKQPKTSAQKPAHAYSSMRPVERSEANHDTGADNSVRMNRDLQRDSEASAIGPAESLRVRKPSLEDDGRPASTSHDFIPPDDIAAHLDLYDAALCCAMDEETLIEIADDFIARLSKLPRSARNDAELIYDKHQTRIAALESEASQTSQSQTETQKTREPD